MARRSRSRPATDVCLYRRRRRSGRAQSAALGELAATGGLRPAELERSLYAKADEAAALHLFRVAAGLDSLVPGRGRRSSARCAPPTRRRDEAGAAGPVLHRLFRQALHAGKRVRTRDGDRREPGVGLVGCRRARGRVFDDLRSASASCLLGAGKMGELAAANLRRARRDRPRRCQPLARSGPRSSRSASGPGRSARSPGRRARRGRRRDRLDRLAGPRADGRAGRARLVGRAAAGRSSSSTSPSRATSTRRSTTSTAATSTTSTTSSASSTGALAGRREEAARAEAIVAGGGRAVPRLAALAGRRPGDRLAARASRGDPGAGARARRRPARAARPRRAAGRRVADRADREQAPPPADGAPEGGGGGRRGPGVRGDACATSSASATTPDGWVGARPARLPRQPARAHAGGARRRRAARGEPGSRGRARADHDGRAIATAQAPFGEIGARGVFVKEIEEALLAGRIDVAVHSAKDMTSTRRRRARPSAPTCRGRTPATRSAAPTASCRACGSGPPRRDGAAQLLALEPDLSIEPLRGNVDTRLRKRGERGLDAIVLAAAGLDRLGLAARSATASTPTSSCRRPVRAPSRCRCGSARRSSSAAVDDAETRRRVEAERACVARIGGGCLAPVGGASRRRGC